MSDHSGEVAKGSFWNLLGNVAFKLVSFFYVVLVARAASQDDLGLFYLSLGIVSFVSVFSDFGISGALVRFVPYFDGRGEKGKIKDLLRVSYAALLAAGIALSAALWLSADFIGGVYASASLPEAIRMLSVFVLINNILRLHQYFMQGLSDMKYFQLMANSQNALKLVLTAILFYFYGASVVTISAGFLLSHLIVTVLSAPKVLAAASSIKGRERLGREELLYSIAPLGLMIAVLQNFSNLLAISDRLILGYLAGPAAALEEVAVYSVLTTLATVLFVFPSSVGGIFLPVFSRLAGQGEKERMKELIDSAVRWTALIAIPAGLVLMMFPQEMLSLLYGPGYARGAAALSVFSAGLIISAVSHIMWLALAGMRMVKVEMLIAGVGGALNIILAFALVPGYGMAGSAAASAISLLVSFLLLLYYCGRLLGYRPGQAAVRLFIPAALTFAALLLLRPAIASFIPGSAESFGAKAVYLLLLGLGAALSYAIFGLVAAASGCFTAEDSLLAKKALMRAGLGEKNASVLSGMLARGPSGPK